MLSRLTTRNADGTVIVDPTIAMYRLADYEDTGFAPEDFKVLKKLCDELTSMGKTMEYVDALLLASKEGRVRLSNPCCGKCCGTCNHFLRYSNRGTNYATGICEIRAAGHPTCRGTASMEVSNTKSSCRNYEPRGRKAFRYQPV